MKKVTMSDIPRTQADMAPLGSGGLMTGNSGLAASHPEPG